jgi:uncharacterized membrane protein YjdF
MKYALLGTRRRQSVREISARCYLEHGNTFRAQQMAEWLLREKFVGFIEAFLIGLAIKLAFELLKWWWDHKVGDPGSVPFAGEPQ